MAYWSYRSGVTGFDPHPIAEAEPLGVGPQLPAVGVAAVADEDEHRLGMVGGHAGEGAQQRALSLAGLERADAQQHDVVVTPPSGGAAGGSIVAGTEGVDAPQGDAVGDRHEAAGIAVGAVQLARGFGLEDHRRGRRQGRLQPVGGAGMGAAGPVGGEQEVLGGVALVDRPQRRQAQAVRPARPRTAAPVVLTSTAVASNSPARKASSRSSDSLAAGSVG